MLKKIAEALADRATPICDHCPDKRTAVYDLDEALRRAEAFHRTGADMPVRPHAECRGDAHSSASACHRRS